MNTPTTLAAYAAALAVVFGAAAGVGGAVGPVGAAPTSHASSGSHGGHAGPDAAVPAADGLAVSQGGYTLVLDAAPPAAGRSAPLAFRVLGPDGAPVTDYEVEHERELHLVVVRRDGTGFQHLHPERDPDGTWSTPVLLPGAGTWKVLADLTPAGAEDGVVLATDVTVPGPVQTQVLPAVQRTATAGDLTVTVRGDLVAGTRSRLVFEVTRDGRPVTDLQPYLGAAGHLVALRDGDLAYLHVHPEGEQPTGGPEVAFGVEVPSAGDYRLFLDLQRDGVVRTAALSLRATPTGSTPTGSTPTGSTPTGTAPTPSTAGSEHSEHSEGEHAS